MTATQKNLKEFIEDRNLQHIMGDIYDNVKHSDGTISNSYAYAKTKKEIILKYFVKNKNFALQVEGIDKSIGEFCQSGEENTLFNEVISRLEAATPVEKDVSSMVNDLDLF